MRLLIVLGLLSLLTVDFYIRKEASREISNVHNGLSGDVCDDAARCNLHSHADDSPALLLPSNLPENGRQTRRLLDNYARGRFFVL